MFKKVYVRAVGVDPGDEYDADGPGVWAEVRFWPNMRFDYREYGLRCALRNACWLLGAKVGLW